MLPYRVHPSDKIINTKYIFFKLANFNGEIWTEVRMAGAELFVQFVGMYSMVACKYLASWYKVSWWFFYPLCVCVLFLLPLLYHHFVPVGLFFCFQPFNYHFALEWGKKPLQACVFSLCNTFLSCVLSTYNYLFLRIHVYKASLHFLCMFSAILVYFLHWALLAISPFWSHLPMHPPLMSSPNQVDS